MKKLMIYFMLKVNKMIFNLNLTSARLPTFSGTRCNRAPEEVNSHSIKCNNKLWDQVSNV